MDTEAMHDALKKTQAGELTFPQLVGVLIEVGVESYRVDLARGEDTFYMADGRTHVEKITLPGTPVSEEFSRPGIVSAIRDAQADTIRYPKFLSRASAAGIVAYWAFLTGRRVVYFGRKGDFHVEEFPRPQARN